MQQELFTFGLNVDYRPPTTDYPQLHLAVSGTALLVLNFYKNNLKKFKPSQCLIFTNKLVETKRITMATTLDKQITAYLPLLGEEEKRSLIGVIQSFIHLKMPETPSIHTEQYNRELAEAEAEYESGDYITHEQMKNNIKQWNRRTMK
ncbi:MAG: hypothetical protein QM610_03985 [Chitinophagaceae bacterium]